MTAKSFNSFTDELRHRLEHLHERAALIGAGVVDEQGHLQLGSREEEPMTERAINSIVASYEATKKIEGQRRYIL
jgi:hypothetical protein